MGLDSYDLGGAVLGLATVGVIAALAGAAAIRLRRRVYTGAKERPVELPFTVPILPPVLGTASDAKEYQAVALLLRSHHERSKLLQDGAVAHLVAASTTLFVAFVTSVAGATILRSWPSFHIYSASLDVAALAVVMWTFVRSARLRAAWIRERVLSEFIRQWADTEFLLSHKKGVITAPYEAFMARAKSALERHDVITATVEYGRVRLKELRDVIAAAPPITGERVSFYLQRRPIYQARWFARSEARILGQSEHRGWIMATLFILAFVAAIAKLLATFRHAEYLADWANLALMIVIGLGTAATSSYFGQNLRSLRHRYGQQVRAIERWFEAHADVAALAQSPDPLQQHDMVRLASAVVEFEALMLVEVVDWISITQHDTMELGPT